MNRTLKHTHTKLAKKSLSLPINFEDMLVLAQFTKEFFTSFSTYEINQEKHHVKNTLKIRNLILALPHITKTKK